LTIDRGCNCNYNRRKKKKKKEANNAKQNQNSEILEANEKGKINMYNKTEIAKRKVKSFHETREKNEINTITEYEIKCL